MPVWGGLPPCRALPPHPGETSREGTALPKPLGPERCRGRGAQLPQLSGARSALGSSPAQLAAHAGARVCLDGWHPSCPHVRGEGQGWEAREKGPRAPLFASSAGAGGQRRRWRRRRCWLPPAAVGRALPSPPARCRLPPCTHFCRCCPASSPLGQPDCCHATGMGTSRACSRGGLLA